MILTKQEKENYNLIDTSYRRDLNVCKLEANNTELHELAKARVCLWLKKNNYKYITEARLRQGGRPDVFDISRGVAFEVIHWEGKESIERKKAKYKNILVVPVNSWEIMAVEMQEDLSEFLG